MNLKEEKAASYVSEKEQDKVSRGLLSWLNQNTSFPAGVKSFAFEYLDEDKPCMALSTIQGAYIIKQYIGGDYMAEYQFKLIYRGQPDTTGTRLSMDEVLNEIADSAVFLANRLHDTPDIGHGFIARKLICNARSSFFGRYENGDEDHQILMTLSYYAERTSV